MFRLKQIGRWLDNLSPTYRPRLAHEAKWLENTWNKSRSVASTLVLAGIVLAILSALYPQSPGVCIGLLATAAGIMSLRPVMKVYEKMAWVGILITFAVLEILAIGRSDKDTKDARERQNKEFSQITANQDTQFKTTVDRLSESYALNQRQFDMTMRQFLQNEKIDQQQFNATMERFDKSYIHEEKLAAAQTGILSPASDPTPSVSCTNMPPDATLIIVDTGNSYSSYFTTSFPRTIVKSASRGPLLSFTRLPGGRLAVITDLFSSDGKLMVRMNEDGYVVNRNNISELKSDNSSLVVIDLYGNETLNVHYANKRTIIIKIKGASLGLTASISMHCADMSEYYTAIGVD
jgi:hypothetical protein